MKYIRTLALLLSVAMLTILLASTAFLVYHADHECNGDHAHCLICEQISLCTQHQKTIALAVVTALLGSLLLGFARSETRREAPLWARETLVTCKVKLSN